MAGKRFYNIREDAPEPRGYSIEDHADERWSESSEPRGYSIRDHVERWSESSEPRGYSSDDEHMMSLNELTRELWTLYHRNGKK